MDDVRTTVRRLVELHGGQEPLAKRLGVRQPMISKWLSGVIPNPTNLKKIEMLAGGPASEGDMGQQVGGAWLSPLDVCVQYHQGKWSPATVAAARAMRWDSRVSPDAWVRRLDAIEAALGSVSKK